MKSSIDSCSLLELDQGLRQNGNLTVVERFETVPFDIQRIYYLYDVPTGKSRGAHAHKDLWQLIIAASGSFNVILDDGKNRKKIFLNRPQRGILVVPGIWRELDDFSFGSVCLVLASLKYDEKDYIRDYKEFLTFKGVGRK